MRVLLTGATGFTGRRAARRLVAAGHDVRCFVRASSDRAPLEGLEVEVRVGDLADEASIARALSGTDALVNVASIGFGHGPGIVRAAERAGVGRAVFFSTTAIFTSLPAASRAVRLLAEEAIRRSSLDWTILRPTMIYGGPGDRNVERLLGLVSRFRVLPTAGRGESRIQPVFVDDLGDAVPAVLGSRKTSRRAYSLPGRTAVTIREFVSAAARALGRRTRFVAVPEAIAVAGARIYERIAPRPRIRAEQVLRFLEHKDFAWDAAARDFGYAPRDIEAGLAIEVARIRGEEA